MLRKATTAMIVLMMMTLLTGVAYPLVVTGVARLAAPRQAAGSLVYQGGRPVGSQLIGQAFGAPGYFQGRPSAAGGGYDAAASGGANLGPTNARLIESVGELAARLRRENALPDDAPVPADLVTASASGLDPHITPAAARLQVGRVAQARGLPEEQLLQLIDAATAGRQLGFLGEPRVNVLELNRAVDQISETA